MGLSLCPVHHGTPPTLKPAAQDARLTSAVLAVAAGPEGQPGLYQHRVGAHKPGGPNGAWPGAQ